MACCDPLCRLVMIVLVLAAYGRAAATEGAGLATVPLWPRDGSTITDVATYFRWRPVPGCTDYEIQVARDRAFADLVRTKKTKNQRYHEDCWFPKDILPAGPYVWRVRALPEGKGGPWSVPASVTVDSDHAVAKDVVRTIDAAHPLFLMRNRAWDPRAARQQVKNIIPPGLERTIVVDDIHLAGPDAVERARAYEELGVDFVVWNNRTRVSLAQIEWFFQTFKHCIGTAEGEHFSGWRWERGPEKNFSEEDWITRAWVLCAKYGRFHFWAEGEGARYQWTTVAHEKREDFQRYRRNIIPMFKSTLADVALHTYGAMAGLVAADRVDNVGMWADEWIWPCGGFGALGAIDQEPVLTLRRKHGTGQCPWVYDLQMWLMGIVSGSTTFSIESAHQWTKTGAAAANYQRFFLPFVRAVVEHRLIPSRQAFLDHLRVAVACDYERAKRGHQGRLDGDFAFLTDLYALKHKPIQEIIPDVSRFGIITMLPPEARCLNPRTQVVPLADLADVAKARALFEGAYPARGAGDAFQWTCDGTAIITNANENTDRDQTFDLPLEQGPVRRLGGTIRVHQYLVGKIEDNRRRFWFQANSNDPQRTMEVVFTCDRRPSLTVAPGRTPPELRWDAATRRAALTLGFTEGAVEGAITTP